MRLDINHREKTYKKPKNTWRLNNTLLNNQEVTEDTKRKIFKYLETNDNENMTIQNLVKVAQLCDSLRPHGQYSPQNSPG